MHTASVVGTPILHPLFFKYPSDPSTYPIDLQFFFGDSLLVSPVTEENSTSVTIYLPSDTFYNFTTFEPIIGNASNITLTDVGFDQIPLLIKGGAILPLREKGAMLTSEVRGIDFEFVVAPSTTSSVGNGRWKETMAVQMWRQALGNFRSGLPIMTSFMLYAPQNTSVAPGSFADGFMMRLYVYRRVLVSWHPCEPYSALLQRLHG